MQFRPTALALAVVGLVSQAQAQQAAPAAEPQKIERVEVTGSMIKRTDKETPSVVQVITSDDIRNSGYASVEELLRSTSAVDTSSIGDGAASGFVGGLSTISLRGFGSQGTLVLINGRRIAPVAAVDVNFGRGTLTSVNTIPKGAIDRVEILKDGASALYGSDAMAGVVNYVLKKEYQGFEGTATIGANEKGAGKNQTAGFTFGFGNLDTQKFNVFGGMEAFHRDNVLYSELKNLGDLPSYNDYLVLNGSTQRFAADSVASLYSNYYKVPTSLAGSTTIGGISVANNSASGINFLGSLPGCPDELTVGKGVPQRLPGFTATTANLPIGMCRYNLDNAAEAISKQDRVSGMIRGTFALSNDLTAYADLSLSKTKTVQTGAKRTFTTALASTATANSIVTWPTLSGKFLSQAAIILPVGHPDNPTNGTAQSQAVQLIPRFEDLSTDDVNELKTMRLVAGVEGVVGAWDVNSAVMYSRIESTRTQKDRLRSSLLTSAIKNATYHFGKWNDAAARATIASDAVNDGDSKIYSIDLNASRELWSMAGGKAAIALGGEVRREELEAIPDANYTAGDYIGLVANGTKGKRDSYAAYSELRLPVRKDLEVQAALRGEHYSDFGNSTTGKLGAKWSVIPQRLAFRGTAATGFRAPGLAQIGDSYVSSFHSFGLYAVPDSLRCAGGVSKANPSNSRDCNVLGFGGVTPNPGSIPTVIAANPNLKAEKSKSFTFGVLMQPVDYMDLALDFWYFQRNNEIRAQRGVDIMEAYNANPNDPVAASQIIRDPNTATWLPGVANSGPIIALTRKYGNYNWTKTSGVDYDWNLRLPNSEFGKFTFSISGTWTPRFDQLVLTGGVVDRYAGTSSSDIPKTKAKLTMNWKKGDWSAFTRLNHQDGVITSTTATCLASTSAANTYLRENGWCKVNPENTVDIGGSYRGFKNLTIAASILNVQNAYDRSTGVPNAFNYWDTSSNPQLGRRYSLTATYTYN